MCCTLIDERQQGASCPHPGKDRKLLQALLHGPLLLRRCVLGWWWHVGGEGSRATNALQHYNYSCTETTNADQITAVLLLCCPELSG